MIRILDPERGDERITWNRKSLKQILEAKALFLKLVKKGLTPYRVEAGGKLAVKAMKEFDASAEEILFKPKGIAVGG